MKALYDLPCTGQGELVPARDRAPRRRLPPAAIGVRVDRLGRHAAHRAPRLTRRSRRHDLAAPLPDDDLRLRAARALQAGERNHARRRHPHSQAAARWGRLGRRQPDAATTLLALNRLWNLHWPLDRLARPGADAGRRCAILRARPQRLRAGRWRTDRADRSAPPVAGGRQARRGAAPRRRSSAARCSSALPRAVILADFLADTQLSDCAKEDSGATTAKRLHNNQSAEVAKRPSGCRRGSATAACRGRAVQCSQEPARATNPLATWGSDDLPPQWVGRMCCSLAVHPLLHWSD